MAASPTSKSGFEAARYSYIHTIGGGWLWPMGGIGETQPSRLWLLGWGGREKALSEQGRRSWRGWLKEDRRRTYEEGIGTEKVEETKQSMGEKPNLQEQQADFKAGWVSTQACERLTQAVRIRLNSSLNMSSVLKEWIYLCTHLSPEYFRNPNHFVFLFGDQSLVWCWVLNLLKEETECNLAVRLCITTSELFS